MRIIRAILVVGFLTTAAPADESGLKTNPATPQQLDFFERRVRPVLIEKCIGCHGPKAQKGGVRVDSRPSLVLDQGAGPMVTPGAPDESPLIEAIRRDGPIKMPPSKGLGPDAIADITAWVKMGAPWPDLDVAKSSPRGSKSKHWAFQPVRKPSTPDVKQADWVRTPLDRFILASLEAKGLSPSPPADKRTLIRRAAFDLIGLPPTPEEVSTFEADASTDAFAKVVDRLLSSPHYGERWGRHWLDVARYADTKGYILFEDANYPWAYTYRDYVVQAFNEDMPYNQFVVEQIAADLVSPGDNKRSLRGLGFLTLGSRFMNNIHDVIDDRIDVMSRGLLGLTVSCARCHDHKFDPIPTADYYSLYGVFANSVEPTTPLLFEEPPATPEYTKFVAELKQKEEKLAEFVGIKHRELVANSKTRAADYLLAGQAAIGQPTTEDFMLIADGNDLNPAMIVRWRVLLERTRKRHHSVLAPWHALAALPDSDFASKAAVLCAGWSQPAESSSPINPLVAKAMAANPPKTLADAAKIYAKLLNEVEACRQKGSSSLDPASEQLSEIFHGPDAPPEVPFDPYGDLALLPDRPSQAKLQELRNAVVNWRSTGPGAPPRAMALVDAPSPSEPRVFLRGNAHNLGQPVPRRFLEALTGDEREPFGAGSGRLELANAIASPANPLTARVLVNRVWMHHFAAPLVNTPSDFGLRSDPPTHPELLDDLASTFMSDGWSIKRLHRQIMLSSTYQQVSNDRSECLKVDPENSLLWKMNRRRRDFETMRDAILSVSGRLDRKVGGASVQNIVSDQTLRRTVYGFIDRLNLPGLFRTFDFPDPNATSAKRDATTVAPQALFLMNHPFVIGASKAILKRPEIVAENDTSRRIERLYSLLLQRTPSAEEQDLGGSFLKQEADPVKSWESYVQALLLINEFMFVD